MRARRAEVGDDREVFQVPEPPEIERQYVRERLMDVSSGRRNSLADDALVVVLEWGPPRRLSEMWRLETRQASVGPAEREAALAAARAVAHLAYELTARAWPHDGREGPIEGERVDAEALETLSSRHPDLDRESLRRAIWQGNYTHWRG